MSTVGEDLSIPPSRERFPFLVSGFPEGFLTNLPPEADCRYLCHQYAPQTTDFVLAITLLGLFLWGH